MMLPPATLSPSSEPAAALPTVPVAADARATEQELRPYRKPLVVTHSREDLDEAAAKVNACVSF